MLESFTVDASCWRTSDLAVHCELPVPTAHRMLGVLQSFGYLVRDPDTREYRLGPAAAGFARSTATHDGLSSLARSVLRSVRSATGADVTLSTFSEAGGGGIEIAGLEHDQVSAGGEVLTKSEQPAQRSGPLHAGASFKVLFAHMPEAEIEAVIKRGLEPVGPGSITTDVRLRAELAAIRRRGWAFSREEIAAGRWAVAVPVVDRAGKVSCALGVVAAVARLDLERARYHLTVLDSAARSLARRLPGGAAAELDGYVTTACAA